MRYQITGGNIAAVGRIENPTSWAYPDGPMLEGLWFNEIKQPFADGLYEWCGPFVLRKIDLNLDL